MRNSSMWHNLVRTTLGLSLQIVLFLLSTFYFLLSTSFAATSYTEDISKIGVGARVMGMGKAFTSVANDTNSIFINPAGLYVADKFHFTSMYTSLFDGDLNYVLFGASTSNSYGKFGFGLISTGTNQIPSPGPATISYFDYYDRLYTLSYSSGRPSLILNRPLYTGLSIKLFNKGFTGSTVYTGTGIDADLGFKYLWDDETSLALCLKNFLPTNIAGDSGGLDEIPLLVKTGFSKTFLKNKLLLAIDADMSPGRNIPTPFHVGAEYYISDYFTLRAGLDQSISASTAVFTNLTAGAGISFGGLKIDYAYHTFNDNLSSISHFVSLSY